MITLATADYIAAIASAASQLSCTIFGMELNGATEVYKVLYQGQLAASATTIYTAPTSNTSFIKSITVVNNDTVPRTFKLYRGGTAATNVITPTFTLLAGCMALYEDALGWQFFNQAGQLLVAQGNLLTNGVVDNWGITGCLAETMDRVYCTETNTTIGTTGQIFLQAIFLIAGTTCTNISIFSATTAASAPTHYAFGLYDISRNLLASTADQTSTAWGANTIKTLAVGTPYLVPTTGLYYIAFSMTATTVCTLKGATAIINGALAGTAPILHGLSSTTYASETLPSTVAAITVGTTSMWASIT